MIKQDEKELLALLQKRTEELTYVNVRYTVLLMGMNEKRAAYILEKWASRGLYEYGVSVLAGWITEEGRQA